MALSIVRHPSASRDIQRQANYLEAHADEKTAMRFLDAVETTLRRLASMPEIGSLCQVENPNLADVRFWNILGFRKHLLVYRIQKRRLEVIRLLHSAQDWLSELESEI